MSTELSFLSHDMNLHIHNIRLKHLRSIISPETDQHDASLSYVALRLKLHLGGDWFHSIPLDESGFITVHLLFIYDQASE
jgi:hypothetical protein